MEEERTKAVPGQQEVAPNGEAGEAVAAVELATGRAAVRFCQTPSHPSPGTSGLKCGPREKGEVQMSKRLLPPLPPSSAALWPT